MSDDILFSWLHLSDIHGGHGDDEYRDDQAWSFRAILDAVGDLPIAIPRVDAIMVTGDVAFSGGHGSADEYALASQRIGDLRQRLGVAADRVFVVPGNHDIDRTIAKRDPAFHAVLTAVRTGELALDDVLRDHAAAFAARLAGYRSFIAAVAPHLTNRIADDGSWSVDLTSSGGLPVRLVGLNTALLAQDDEDQGRLRIGSRQLSVLNQDRDPGRVVLTLGHHPLPWLADDPAIVDRVARYSDAYLHGHVHRQTFTSVTHGGGDQAVMLVAGAVHVDPKEANARFAPRDAFNIGAVVGKVGTSRLRIAPFVRHEHQFVLDAANVPRNRLQAELPLPIRAQPTGTIAAAPPASHYRSPLDVYVAWDRRYAEGTEMARRLYALLHRDPHLPFVPGLDIPVFYRTAVSGGAVAPTIPPAAQQSAVIVLADVNLARDDEWNQAVRELASDQQGRRTYVVALSDLALKIRGANEKQFIRVGDLTGVERDRDVENRLLHLLTRQLLGGSADDIAEPIRVFMSHAKADGEPIAKRLRSFLQDDERQLDTFYDRRNITPGSRFASVIARELADPRALLLVVLTNEFVNRPVCREEVAKAMLERRPIVVVDARTNRRSVNPAFLGPVPTLKYVPELEDFWRELLRTVMSEALRFAYVPAYLRAIESLYVAGIDRSLHIARTPLLQDVGDGNAWDRLLYPDPPLFDADREPFTRSFARLHLATPSTLPLVLP